MASIDDPRAPRLRGGQADGDPGDRSYYTWAGLLTCSIAITIAITVTTNTASIYTSLLLVSLVGSLFDSHNLDIHAHHLPGLLDLIGRW